MNTEKSTTESGAAAPAEPQWLPRLVEQIDWHWTNHLRPRLEGTTDEEYFWEPVPGSWTVHPRGTGISPYPGAVAAGGGDFVIDFAFPEPEPAPLTTIAWRLGHIIVGVLGARNAAHFGAPEMSYESHDYAGSASAALRQLDDGYARWITGVRGLGEERLFTPCGPAEGPYAKAPLADLVLHINRELIHHGAEIALLRDLYLHRSRAGVPASSIHEQ